jgi:hypothetical protein
MKTILVAAATMLSLSAGTALAAPPPQYNVVGNPFPFSARATFPSTMSTADVVAEPPANVTGSRPTKTRGLATRWPSLTVEFCRSMGATVSCRPPTRSPADSNTVRPPILRRSRCSDTWPNRREQASTMRGHRAIRLSKGRSSHRMAATASCRPLTRSRLGSSAGWCLTCRTSPSFDTLRPRPRSTDCSQGPAVCENRASRLQRSPYSPEEKTCVSA